MSAMFALELGLTAEQHGTQDGGKGKWPARAGLLCPGAHIPALRGGFYVTGLQGMKFHEYNSNLRG
jgi:hypothetical protein